MENRTVLVEQKIKNIQSDFGSVDYESVKKFHNQLIPKLIDNARAFGASNLPQNAEYEQLLISRYSALYTELIADETTMAEELRTCYNQTREDYFNTSEGHINYEITRIKQEFEKAKILYSRLLGETNGSPFLMNKPWMIYLVLVVLGILELPLNQSVFAPLALGTGGTLFLAILLLIVTPILAHFCGKFLKQYKERTVNLVIGSSIAVFLIGLTIFLSDMRYLFFQAKATEGGYDTFQEAYNAAQQALTMSKLMASPVFWTSFLLNFGLILAGFLLAFLTHDSMDAYEKTYRDFTFRRPKLIQQLSATRKEQYRNYRIQGASTQTREQRLLEKMTEYHRMHEALSKHVENLGYYIDGLCKEAINEFRMHNQLARMDIQTIPRHWKDGWEGFTAVTPKKIKPIFVEAYTELENSAAV